MYVVVMCPLSTAMWPSSGNVVLIGDNLKVDLIGEPVRCKLSKWIGLCKGPAFEKKKAESQTCRFNPTQTQANAAP